MMVSDKAINKISILCHLCFCWGTPSIVSQACVDAGMVSCCVRENQRIPVHGFLAPNKWSRLKFSKFNNFQFNNPLTVVTEAQSFNWIKIGKVGNAGR